MAGSASPSLPAAARAAPAGPRHGRTLMAAAVLLLVLLTFATRHPVLAAAAIPAALLLVAEHWLRGWEVAPRERLAIGLVVAVVGLSAPLAVARDLAAAAHAASVLLALAMAVALTRDLAHFAAVLRMVLVTVLTAVALFLARSGLADFPLERLLPNSSSNGITSYLVVLQSAYGIACWRAHRRAPLLTPLATLVVCVVGYGRGSILAAAALVGLSYASLLSPRRPWRALTALLLLAGLGGSVLQRHGDDIAAFVELNTKIGAGLQDEHRRIQIDAYLGRVDGVSLLAGAGYAGTPIETDYNRNPHNSYIRAHHIFGLPYLAAMLLFPLLLAGRSLFTGGNGLPALYLLVMLLRAVTEPVLFPTLLDVAFLASGLAMARPVPTPNAAAGRRGGI